MCKKKLHTFSDHSPLYFPFWPHGRDEPLRDGLWELPRHRDDGGLRDGDDHDAGAAHQRRGGPPDGPELLDVPRTNARPANTTLGTLDTNEDAAPPKDAAGLTGTNQVGPHQAHVNPASATQIMRPIKCSECHTFAVDTYTTGHMNGLVDVSFANATTAKLGCAQRRRWTAMGARAPARPPTATATHSPRRLKGGWSPPGRGTRPRSQLAAAATGRRRIPPVRIAVSGRRRQRHATNVTQRRSTRPGTSCSRARCVGHDDAHQRATRRRRGLHRVPYQPKDDAAVPREPAAQRRPGLLALVAPRRQRRRQHGRHVDRQRLRGLPRGGDGRGAGRGGRRHGTELHKNGLIDLRDADTRRSTSSTKRDDQAARDRLGQQRERHWKAQMSADPAGRRRRRARPRVCRYRCRGATPARRGWIASA